MNLPQNNLKTDPKMTLSWPQNDPKMTQTNPVPAGTYRGSFFHVEGTFQILGLNVLEADASIPGECGVSLDSWTTMEVRLVIKVLIAWTHPVIGFQDKMWYAR